ncbi:hypothetical protein BSLG_006751 [Batrachochytrium salamandrivorans]|nr:hypothetical protein BSLG_006751 [Batrachochytrium salamandrivorans]
MPPKVQQKKKAQAIEDKTFGLKNKNKSAKVNRYVQEVVHQVQTSGNKKERDAAEIRKKEAEAKKKADEQKKAEIAELFKPIVVQQKIPFGVDPKTVLCAHFKAGQCQKGPRCKFSHDLNIERKAAKLDIYTDTRSKEEDTMDNWDQAKLEDAVRQKHTEGDNRNKPTDIVCKFFVESIETRKYGWFWEWKDDTIVTLFIHVLEVDPLYEMNWTRMDQNRHNLGSDLIPVTADSFAKWKAERKEREKRENDELMKNKMEEFKKMKAGMKTGMSFSGKELFDFNPEGMQADGDDEDAVDDYDGYYGRGGEDEGTVEVAEDLFADVDGLEDDAEDEE